MSLCRRQFVAFFLGTLLARAALAATVLLLPEAPDEAGVTLLSSAGGVTELEFRLRELQIDSVTTEGKTWAAVHVPGMAVTTRGGWPELPEQSVWLELAGGNPQLEILERDTLRRGWGVPRPAPAPQSRSAATPLRMADPGFYQAETTYPAEPAEISLSGRMGETPLALVTFRPVSFNPQSHDWTVCTRLRVRISSPDRAASRATGRTGDPFRPLVQRTVINPGPTDPGVAAPAPQLLIVSEPTFLPALQPLIAWKMRAGMPVLTLTASTAQVTAEGVRRRIRQLCDSLSVPPAYLLLVGDVDFVPAFFGIDNSLTDHPYSLRTDNDYLPDICVGRLPCRSVTDCEIWVSRLLAYERDAGLSPAQSGTVFSSSVWYDPQHGVSVGTLLQASGLDPVDRLQQPQTSALGMLLGSLNAGRQWVFYIGHGSASGWTSVDPMFGTSSLPQLTAASAPVVISVACATADLDYPGASFAEQWLAQPGMRGPLAYFGATENTAFLRSDTIGLAALRGVFSQHLERLGLAADYGRLAAAQAFPQGGGGLTEETIQQFVLLGDPSLRLFTAVPQPLVVTHASTLPVGSGELTVQAARGAVPIADGNVCVAARDSSYYQVFRTDAAGRAVFPIFTRAPVTLDITVTATNAIPYLGTVAVVADNRAALELCAVTVVDSSGDNDGFADRGEHGALRMQFRNRGGMASAAGTLQVSSADARLVLSTTELALPAVGSRDSLWLTDMLPFTVADTVSDGALALLHLVYRNSAGDSIGWISPLTLHAPQFAFLGSAIAEDSGDGDGRAEGGERLALRLRFSNTGSDAARQWGWQLGPLPSGVTALRTGGDISTLAPGDSLTVTALVHAASALAPGFPLEFTWRDSAANIPLEGGWDRVRIGQVPVFLYVLDPQPQQVDAISQTLGVLGVGYERGSLLPADLFRYSSVWIFCGIFPNAVALGAAEAERLRQYLDGGGRVYWEGGDVWVFDPRTVLHPYFHIRGTQDGSADAGPVTGEANTPAAGCQFGYGGENNFIDRLAADSGAVVWLRNARGGASYPLCIGYAGSTYRTVGSSVELGLLADGTYPSTRIRLLRELLGFFDIPCNTDVQPPVIHAEPLLQVLHAARPIPIAADIQDASGIAAAEVRYWAGEGIVQTLPMTLVNGYYRAALPATPGAERVAYRIRATDASPLQLQAESDEYTLALSFDPRKPLTDNPAAYGALALPGHIGGSGSGSITAYPDSAPALELHATDGAVFYTTDPFDGSGLESPVIRFWHYLRRGEEEPPAVARVVGSTDGGRTFSQVVWEAPRTGGGLLTEGEVVIPDADWMSGQANLALRFEFCGEWYWRLRGIAVTSTAPPRTAPVRDLVIGVASPGVRLTWSSVPEARTYSVRASVTMADSGFKEIFRTRDTVFIDLDTAYAERYYEVVALLDEAVPATPPTAMTAQPAAVRLPDLRWNRKLAR